LVEIEVGLGDLEHKVEEVDRDGCVREEVAVEEGGEHQLKATGGGRNRGRWQWGRAA
jgi:hypothetical protein